MVLEAIGWTIENFDNLSTQVRKYFLSVENMSICNNSPVYEEIGVSPRICL